MSSKFPIVLKHLALALAWTSMAASAQSPMTATAMQEFEARLAELRYQNYVRLHAAEKDPDSKAAFNDFLGPLNRFATENQKEIRQYKIARLEKHRQDKLDLSGYTLDDSREYGQKFRRILNNQGSGKNDLAPFMSFLMIEPDEMLLARIHEISPWRELMGTFVGMHGLELAPKLRTVKLQEGVYRMAWDFHIQVYVADYRVDDDAFMNPQVFVRGEIPPASAAATPD